MTTVAKFETHDVRVNKIDDSVWFHLGDVCKVLGIKNQKDVAAKLRRIENGAGVGLFDSRNSRGEMRKTNFVKEDFLYFDVIPKSSKPTARAFAKWARGVLKDAVRGRSGEIKATLARMTPELVIANRDSISRSREVMLKALEVFGNDDRMTQYIQDQFVNMGVHPVDGTNLLTAPKLLGVTELLEDNGWEPKNILKKRVSLGHRVAKEFRKRYKTDPKICKKTVNGHRVDVKVYETKDHAWILKLCNK